MSEAYIRNHQHNEIKKRIGHLQNACNTVSDRKVVEALRNETEVKLSSLFPESNEQQKQLLGGIDQLQSTTDFQSYLRALEPHLAEFPHVTENQLKKLFPKNKKLKVPDLTSIDYRFVTYLGWVDIASNRLFIVYPLNGKLVGIEGKYTPTNKKGVCFVCNRHTDVALYTAVTKWKPAGVSSDYYRAIGNYLCAQSEVCNQNITSVEVLEKFIHGVLVGP